MKRDSIASSLRRSNGKNVCVYIHIHKSLSFHWWKWDESFTATYSHSVKATRGWMWVSLQFAFLSPFFSFFFPFSYSVKENIFSLIVRVCLTKQLNPVFRRVLIVDGSCAAVTGPNNETEGLGFGTFLVCFHRCSIVRSDQSRGHIADRPVVCCFFQREREFYLDPIRIRTGFRPSLFRSDSQLKRQLHCGRSKINRLELSLPDSFLFYSGYWTANEKSYATLRRCLCTCRISN